MGIMAQNKELFPEFDALSPAQKTFLANLNINSGVAEAYEKDGQIIGVGGIRYVGLGEAWCMATPMLRRDKFQLFRLASNNFKKIVRDKNLWRVFANNTISENFIKHLGFAKSDNTLIWTKQCGQ